MGLLRLAFCVFAISNIAARVAYAQTSAYHGSGNSGLQGGISNRDSFNDKDPHVPKKDNCLRSISRADQDAVADAYNKIIQMRINTNSPDSLSLSPNLNSGTVSKIVAGLTKPQQIALTALIAAKVAPIPGCGTFLKASNKNDGTPDVLGQSFKKAFEDVQLQAHKAFRSNSNTPFDLQKWMVTLWSTKFFLDSEGKKVMPEMMPLIRAIENYKIAYRRALEPTEKAYNYLSDAEKSCLSREIIRRNSHLKEILMAEGNLASRNSDGGMALNQGAEFFSNASYTCMSLAVAAPIAALSAAAGTGLVGAISAGTSAAKNVAISGISGFKESLFSGETAACDMAKKFIYAAEAAKNQIGHDKNEIITTAIASGVFAMLPGAVDFAKTKIPSEWKTAANPILNSAQAKRDLITKNAKELAAKVFPKVQKEAGAGVPSVTASIGVKTKDALINNIDKAPTALSMGDKTLKATALKSEADRYETQASMTSNLKQKAWLSTKASFARGEANKMMAEASSDLGNLASNRGKAHSAKALADELEDIAKSTSTSRLKSQTKHTAEEAAHLYLEGTLKNKALLKEGLEIEKKQFANASEAVKALDELFIDTSNVLYSPRMLAGSSMLDPVRQHLWNSYFSKSMTTKEKEEALEAVHKVFTDFSRELKGHSVQNLNAINALLKQRIDREIKNRISQGMN